jgi:hypothetical protein
MDSSELQKLIESVVARVLSERATAPRAAPRGRVLIAVCCEACIGDARGQFDELQSSGVEITLPREDDLRLTTQRDELVNNCDVLVLPSINDAETGKIALGLFDEPHLRLVQAALAFGKPVLAALYTPYDAALKRNNPRLLRLYDDYRRALGGLNIDVVEQAQIAAQVRARLNVATPRTPSTRGKKLITARDVEEMARQQSTPSLAPGAIITPLARDRAKELNVRL